MEINSAVCANRKRSLMQRTIFSSDWHIQLDEKYCLFKNLEDFCKGKTAEEIDSAGLSTLK